MRYFLITATLISALVGVYGQRRASFGEPCNRLTRCDSRAALSCRNGKCECFNSDIMRHDVRYGRCAVLAGERCVFTTVEGDGRGAEGRSWREEIPCVPSASCENGFCTCFHGYYETSNNTCAPKKDHREDCDTDQACRDDKFLVCDETNRCDCNSTVASYDFQRQLCVRKAGILCGELGLCVTHAYCRSTDLDNSQATATCQCENGFFANEQGVCERKRGYNESCTDDSNCLAEDYIRLICGADKRCGCDKNVSFYDTNSNTCRRLAGASCADFPVCVENSECGRLRDFFPDAAVPTCDCAVGYFPTKQGTCELQHLYGENCDKTDHCKQGLTCADKRCQCDASTSVYDKVKRKCVGLANSFCDDSDNCITHSECLWAGDNNRRQCVCSSGYAQSSNGSCLGSYDIWCSDDWTFACNGEQGLICQEGKCGCKYAEFQTFERELGKCISQINGPCGDSVPCGDNANCTVGDEGIPRCQCRPGFIGVDGYCQLEYGSRCNFSTVSTKESPRCDTMARLYCIEGTCRCPSLQEYDSVLQQCRGLVGASCYVGNGEDESQEFCVDGAECQRRRFHDKTSGICRCKKPWKANKARRCYSLLTEEQLVALIQPKTPRERRTNGTITSRAS